MTIIQWSQKIGKSGRIRVPRKLIDQIDEGTKYKIVIMEVDQRDEPKRKT